MIGIGTFIAGVLFLAFALVVSASIVANAIERLVGAVLALRHELAMRPVALPKSDSLTTSPLMVRHNGGWRYVAYAEVERTGGRTRNVVAD